MTIEKARSIVVGLAAAFALTFGVNEAFGARSAIMDPNCPIDYNWCAPSQQGGAASPDDNCAFCCIAENYMTGICFSYDESENQGCVCWG